MCGYRLVLAVLGLVAMKNEGTADISLRTENIVFFMHYFDEEQTFHRIRLVSN